MNVHETKQYSSTMGIPMLVAYAAMPVGNHSWCKIYRGTGKIS